MDTTGYIVNGVLVLLVLRQLQERRLDLRSLVRPVLLVAAAAAFFLHTIPTGGNDLVLELALAAAGATMGAASALATHVRVDGSAVLARAGLVAASLWVGGVGARMAFAYAAGHGFGPAIGRFSVAHGITGSSAWVAALVLMALADVTSRLVVLHARGRRLERRSRATQARPIVFA